VFEGFSRAFVREAINRSSENAVDRRRFLRAAGIGGAGLVGVGVLGGCATGGPDGVTSIAKATEATEDPAISDAAVLNFALNLEYLEAEFYHYAVFGYGLANSLLSGSGHLGRVTGGAQVPFKTPRFRKYAQEIASDEVAHVKFLRSALGDAKVSRPDIDIKNSFTAAARAAGLISSTQTFNP